MPANLTPEYQKADLRYRQATSDEERLAADGSARAGLIVVSKADLAAPGTIAALKELCAGGSRQGGDATPCLDVLAASARSRAGLDELFERLWGLLAMIRVYSKEPGKPADMHKPFIVPAGATVEELARQIHRDLPDRMKFARLWGHSRFEGQQVHKTEALRDRDVVEIHE